MFLKYGYIRPCLVLSRTLCPRLLARTLVLTIALPAKVKKAFVRQSYSKLRSLYAVVLELYDRILEFVVGKVVQ